MLLLFLLLMAFFIITADEDERPTPDQVGIVGLNLSEEVLAYQGDCCSICRGKWSL